MHQQYDLAEDEYKDFIENVSKVRANPYWKRALVAQEVVLAKMVRVISKYEEIDWQPLCQEKSTRFRRGISPWSMYWIIIKLADGWEAQQGPPRRRQRLVWDLIP
jgi:hypothetical protein